MVSWFPGRNIRAKGHSQRKATHDIVAGKPRDTKGFGQGAINF